MLAGTCRSTLFRDEVLPAVQKDPHPSYEIAARKIQRREQGRLVVFNDTEHWVLHDKPEEVHQLIINHFRI